MTVPPTPCLTATLPCEIPPPFALPAANPRRRCEAKPCCEERGSDSSQVSEVLRAALAALSAQEAEATQSNSE